MPKEAFGGDDDSGGGGGGAKKKISLSKFGLSPDANIRDVFWKVMGSYAATKKPGADLAGMANDRFALMRAAVSVLANPQGDQYGLSPRFIATYTLMMLADGGWKDAFYEFLEKGLEAHGEGKAEIAQSLARLLAAERYKEILTEFLTSMLRGRATTAVALAYIAAIGDEGLVRALKKELVIIARGDIGENQLNAIKAVSIIRSDDEIRKSLIIILSHWDSGARLAAAEALEGLGGEPDVKAAAEKRLATEIDEDVKKALERIVKI